MSSRLRLAVVASHPVQYNVAWFRALAEAVDLEVLYCHRPSGKDQSRTGSVTISSHAIPGAMPTTRA